MRMCAPYVKRETFSPLSKTLKEILAMENLSFPPYIPLIGISEKQNLNKFCDYHEDKGHNTNDCYHLKKLIEEAVTSRNLAHLVKDIRQGSQRNKGQGREGMNVINMVVSSLEIMYEHCFRSFGAYTRSMLRKSSAPLVGFSGEIYHPLGLVDLRVTMGEPGRSKAVILEFSIVKCCSPYNIILGRTWMRSHEAMLRIREQAILRNISIPGQRPRKEPMLSEESWPEDTVRENVIIYDGHPDQPMTINDKLSVGCKQKLVELSGGTWMCSLGRRW
ncbi:hypothetical protein Tco_0909093 [Tanacetum coccineum]|uniref:Reverse transcriptase domain-containing protein n=1 Tax=Tanacetum coccineum TaxID=301880 RepID=A0ABQ5CR58_9ASTR